MPLKRNAMPLAERNIDGSGGTLYRRQGVTSMPPGRNAMPLAERNIDATGGTLYRCRGVASMTPGRNAMPLAERNIDGSGGTLYRRRELQGQLWLALGTLLDTMFFDDAQALQFSTGIG